MGLENLLRLEETGHFWIQGKQLAIEEMVCRLRPSNLLDIGCGTGSVLKQLSSEGIEITGIDILPQSVELCKKTLPKATVMRGDATHLPLRDSCFELVLALDVLEHVRRDDLLLAEAFRALKPGGRLIIIVPALRWLFRERDRGAGHLRRYHRKELVSILNRTGFSIESLNYYNFFLFPLIVLSRLLHLREDSPPSVLNSFFAFIVKAEAKLSRRWSFPWGSSLMVRGVKPDV